MADKWKKDNDDYDKDKPKSNDNHNNNKNDKEKDCDKDNNNDHNKIKDKEGANHRGYTDLKNNEKMLFDTGAIRFFPQSIQLNKRFQFLLYALNSP